VYTILYEGDNQAIPFGRGGGLGGRRRGGRFPQAQRERPDGRKVMQQIARETGGGFFEVKNKTSIDDVYDRIEEELRNQYNLGFSPDKGGPSGFRRINVTVKPKGMTVQTREGYYPGS
jgi:VWFA-related protein